MSTFAVIYKPGSNWVAGRPFHEQERIGQHREFLNDEHSAGHVLVAGPFLDDSGGFAIFEAASADELTGMLDRDATVQHEILTYEIHPCALPFMRLK